MGETNEAHAIRQCLTTIYSVRADGPHRRLTSVRSVSDLQQYGIAERWTLPTKGKGDCEDYALYKKYELTRAGFPAEQLLIATLLDLNRASHAVLVVRTGANDLVLDNLTNKIVPWHKTGYTFLRMQDPRKP